MPNDVIIRQSRSGGLFAQRVETDSFDMDLTELVMLAEDLHNAGARLSLQIPKIVKRGAQNIKTDAQRRYRAQSGKHGKGHAPAYPHSITYDMFFTAGSTIAVIGPDKERKQGALGNLIEFGSANNPPLPHLVPAFNEEVPKTQIQLLVAALKAVFPT